MLHHIHISMLIQPNTCLFHVVSSSRFISSENWVLHHIHIFLKLFLPCLDIFPLFILPHDILSMKTNSPWKRIGLKWCIDIKWCISSVCLRIFSCNRSSLSVVCSQNHQYHLGGLVAKSCLTLATPWTVACQPPLSMRFSRQEYWSGWPFPPPGDLPNPGIKLGSPALQADFFTNWSTIEAPVSPWRNANLHTYPDLQNLKLHFNKIPRWFILSESLPKLKMELFPPGGL